MSQVGMACCPRCDRTIRWCDDRFVGHSTTHKGTQECCMSLQFIPINGVSDRAFELRAKLVTDLARQVQDVDPHLVYEVLTGVPAVELQRMLMVALAAIPVDRSLRELFRWVVDLPVAREAVSA